MPGAGQVLWLDLAVVGAHLEGQPLHHELLDHGARLRSCTTTAPCYRLYTLAGGPPARAGLVRVADDGYPIDVEVYRLPRVQLGDLLATVPPPLAIGTVQLAAGEAVHGFVCEPIGIHGARDISECGGWRAYLSIQG